MTLSPLQPIRGRNLKEYRAFRRDFHSAITESAKRIGEVKRENPNYSIEHPESIQEVYAEGLELMLVEATQEEKKFAPVSALVEAVGVPLTDASWELALTRHIRTSRAIPGNAESILGQIRGKSGMTYSDSNAVRNNVALNLVHGGIGDIKTSLAYLTQMTGDGDFSNEVIQRINGLAVARLGDEDFDTADELSKYLPKDICVPETHKAELYGRISRWGARGGFSSIKQLEERVPGIFTPERAAGMGIEFLGNLEIGKYDELLSTFQVEELDDAGKKSIREKVINHLKGHLGDYEKISSLNERIGTTITATPEELREIVAEKFKMRYGRFEVARIAEVLNQELDPAQIGERYVALIKEGDHESRREAGRLFEDANIPISEEAVKELTMFSRPDQKIARILDCRSLGYQPSEGVVNDLVRVAYRNDNFENFSAIGRLNQKPSHQELEEMISSVHKDPEKKVDWISQFKADFDFTLSERIRDRIYSELIEGEPSYEGIDNLMDVTDSKPPIEVVNSILAASCERYDLGLKEKSKWDSPNYHLDVLVRNLTKREDISISDEQKAEVSQYIKETTNVDSVSLGIRRANILYNFRPKFSETEQRKMLSLVETGIAEKSYSDLKRRGSDYFRACKPVEGIFEGDVLNEAGQRLGELVTQGDIYQAWIYAETTGAKPNLTTDQYTKVQSQFSTQRKRFYKANLPHVEKMIESWNPEQGGTE